MDTMAKKYSYPKNEVTAGVGYGVSFNLLDVSSLLAKANIVIFR